MIRQMLLTTPGERADLPTFGCGLRQLLFAPNSDALQATTQLLMQHSLTAMAGQSDPRPDRSRSRRGPGGDYSQILVQVDYVLIETQSLQTTAGPGDLT